MAATTQSLDRQPRRRGLDPRAALSVLIGCIFFLAAHAADRPPTFPAGAKLDVSLLVNTVSVGNDAAFVDGQLRIRNTSLQHVTVLHPDSDSALSFYVTDDHGNVVTPEPFIKVESAAGNVELNAGGLLTHTLSRFAFVSSTGSYHYPLMKTKRYRIIAVYRPLGLDGPGFASKEIEITAK